MDGAFIVTTIISSISAIAAAAAVVVTLRIHHQDSLPSIVLYLYDDHDKGAVELVLANVGKGVARNVHIEAIDPHFVQEGYYNGLRDSFLFREISCLAPGVELRTVIAAGSEGHKECIGKRCDVVVSYGESGFVCGTHRASVPFSLAYADVFGSLSVKSDLHDIRDGIKKMSKSLDSVASRLSQ